MEELVIASSSVAEGGIGCWDLKSGAEQLRYKTCASTPHGLACVGGDFLASSQLREPSASSGSVFYWSWSKPQVEVKSFPAEPINAIAANSEGTYLVGGGQSGDIYLWEVLTGHLIKKWRAHYRAVTCLVFSEDNSLLVSGSEDGCIRVWSLITLFDDHETKPVGHRYLYSFTEHALRVTDVVIGHGGWNATIVSASEDRTSKVWRLYDGKLLRNITFPSIIDKIVLEPAEQVFYAGCRDGNIYVAALSAPNTSTSGHGKHIVGSFSGQSKAVTCLAYSTQNLLLSGSDDGMIRVWDPRTHNMVRVFRHAKGPVNNILVVQRPPHLTLGAFSSAHSSSRRQESMVTPSLEKYMPPDDEVKYTAMKLPRNTCDAPKECPFTGHLANLELMKKYQGQGLSAKAESEVERLKLECKRSAQMAEQWKKMYENLHEFCVNELLDGDQGKGT